MKPSHPIGQVEKEFAIDGQIIIRSLQVRYKLTIPYVCNHKNESFGIFKIYYLWYHKLHEHSVRTKKKAANEFDCYLNQGNYGQPNWEIFIENSC